MKKLMIVLSCVSASSFYALNAFGLDFTTATGADIVKENASKKGGYMSAQKKELIKGVSGRALTFEDGVVMSVGTTFDGKVKVSIKFSVPGASIMDPDWYVDALPKDETTAQMVQALDEKAKIKKVSGVVKSGSYGFVLECADIIPEVMPSLAAEYDPNIITGAEIVRYNASKKGGLSSAKKEKLIKSISGRTLTFENGVVTSVGTTFDGKVKVSIKFSVPGASIMDPDWYVDALPKDETTAQMVQALDEKAKIKKVSGVVKSGNYGFVLECADIIPEVMPSLAAEYDAKNITGGEIVKYNASKKGGLSSVKKEELIKAISGRTLTFENGVVTSVGTTFDGKVKVSIKFSVPGASIMDPDWYVDALPKDETTAQMVQALDEKAKIKKVSGVVKSGSFGFVLECADIVPEVMPSQAAEYDPNSITGAEIVKYNASKKGGLSSAKRKKLIKSIAGRKLTFENGVVTSVRTSFDNRVVVTIRFSAPNAGIMDPDWYVDAMPSSAADQMAAKKIDEKTKIAKISGIVKDSAIGCVLECARIEVAK